MPRDIVTIRRRGGYFVPAVGAVTLDAVGTAVLSGTAVNTANLTSLTIGPGATALVLSAVIQTTSANVGTITATWNGVSMTQLTTGLDTLGASTYSVILGMVNPAAGANTLTINWSGTATQVAMNAVSFVTPQTTLAGAFPSGSRLTGTFTGTTYTVSPTTAPGHFLVAAWASNADVYNSVSGTQLYKPASPNVVFNAGNYAAGSAGSISATANTSSPQTSAVVDVSP